MKFVCCFLVSLFALIQGQGNSNGNGPKNYCDPNLCDPDVQHTGCRNNGAFASNCPQDLTIRKLSKSEEELILSYANFYRSAIASGSQETYPGSGVNYPTASRMMTLVYSQEQAVLAMLNIKKCLNGHDPCHNTFYNTTTQKVVQAGQNIFYTFKGGERPTFASTTNDAFYNWYKEYQVTPLDAISSLYFPSSYTIGHFTALVHDLNTQIGCAVGEYTTENKSLKQTIYVCNFYKAPYANQPVWEQGATCSNCKKCDYDLNYGLCLR